MRQNVGALFVAVILLVFQGCSPAKQQDACGYVQNVYGERISWKGQLPIVLHIHSSVPSEYLGAIQSAAKTWNTAAGKTVFEIADGTTSADPTREDRVNTIAFSTTWDSSALSEQAKTAVHWVGDQIQEADIQVNASKRVNGAQVFNFYWDSTPDNGVNVEALVLHEMGHVLGLKHKTETASVMQPYLANDTDRVKLGETDLQSLQCEY